MKRQEGGSNSVSTVVFPLHQKNYLLLGRNAKLELSCKNKVAKYYTRVEQDGVRMWSIVAWLSVVWDMMTVLL